MLLLGILVLTGLVLFVVVHVGELERFALLLSHAEPSWLILAVILQAVTYLCAGVIWQEVTRPRANSVPTRALFRLSVEQLSVNQIVPTGGVAGNLLVFHAIDDWVCLHGSRRRRCSRKFSQVISPTRQ